jgi:hypothetical protein
LQGRRLTVLSSSHTVDTQSRVLLGNLPTLDIRQSINRAQPRVLSERERDSVQSLSERPHRVLLDRGDLVGLLGNGDRGADLGRASSVDDPVVTDEVPDDADGVVQSSFGLVDDLREVKRSVCRLISTRNLDIPQSLKSAD